MNHHIDVPITMLHHDSDDAIAAEWDAGLQRERRDLDTALGYSLACVEDSLRALLSLIDLEDPQLTRTYAGHDAEHHLRDAAHSLRSAARCITAPALYSH
ncbi:hypothetical protein ACI2LF_43825 [Kribbella sp. NPDC020789]